MATLRGLLDQVTELLQYEGKYKSFGDLQKAKYQQSKGEEDKEIRRIMYEGSLGNSEEAKAKAKETRKKNKAAGKHIESTKKAAKIRSDWYKDPENLENFKKALQKRDKKRRN